MKNILQRLYGKKEATEAFSRITALMAPFGTRSKLSRGFFTETDAILITYGDTLTAEGQPPLKTLCQFSHTYFKGLFSTIHILPFYPYSSDDGFSVTEFKAVNPALGTWRDIRAMGTEFKLMVDLVINHVSAQSQWFQDYLAEVPGSAGLAIEVDPDTDLSAVTRPRSLPLLTPFAKQSGRKVHLWTTFSADQVDLNYQNLDVLETMLQTLLHYIIQGARLIRLDAIAYLWKTIGTNCIHLPQTHDMVRLLRSHLDHVAPQVALITETNVPHAENIAYFGDGYDQAQMVYNFTLPPLLLYCLHRETAQPLTNWARTLKTPSGATTFLNFTASHDGIGVRPLEGILPPGEIRWLANQTIENGGSVSTRRQPDGTDSPYELNLTYLDALKKPDLSRDPLHIDRFLASQSVALTLPGVPAVYIHSMLGSRNWHAGVQHTGRARTINRQPLSAPQVAENLAAPDHFRARIYRPYARRLRIRAQQPAFHPNAGFKILELDPRVFAIQRSGHNQTLLALTNFSAQPLTLSLPAIGNQTTIEDILNNQTATGGKVALKPYASAWLNLPHPGPDI